MECRDVSVVGIAHAGELGLEVEVDELGRDSVRELQSNLPGLLDDRLAPSQMHHVHPGRGGQLFRVPRPRTKTRPLQDRLPRLDRKPTPWTRGSPRRRRPRRKPMRVLVNIVASCHELRLHESSLVFECKGGSCYLLAFFATCSSICFWSSRLFWGAAMICASVMLFWTAES